ncbi:MAG TPA: GNAT family N-acetyltransferase [Azospirillaceae bacterium]|nr:GNAT family N-acetyltransferase [Azospirillaceae bacterium]
MVAYRKLLLNERNDYALHLKRLEGADRRSRFTGAVGDAGIDLRCGRLDWTRTIVVGAFVDGILRGAAELSADVPLWRPGGAELAVSVERPFQGRGIGTELTRRALNLARNRRLAPVTMVCLMDNSRMQRIARTLRADVRLGCGEVRSAFEPGLPDQLSLLQEGIEDWTALVSGLIDRFQPLHWA